MTDPSLTVFSRQKMMARALLLHGFTRGQSVVAALFSIVVEPKGLPDSLGADATHYYIGSDATRDPRCVHRGTPNKTDVPLAVAVLGFDRAGQKGRGHQEENSISQKFYNSLSQDEQHMYLKVPRSGE